MSRGNARKVTIFLGVRDREGEDEGRVAGGRIHASYSGWLTSRMLIAVGWEVRPQEALRLIQA